MDGWREGTSEFPGKNWTRCMCDGVQSDPLGDLAPIEALNCQLPWEVAVAMKMVWGNVERA